MYQNLTFGTYVQIKIIVHIYYSWIYNKSKKSTHNHRDNDVGESSEIFNY